MNLVSRRTARAALVAPILRGQEPGHLLARNAAMLAGAAWAGIFVLAGLEVVVAKAARLEVSTGTYMAWSTLLASPLFAVYTTAQWTLSAIRSARQRRHGRTRETAMRAVLMHPVQTGVLVFVVYLAVWSVAFVLWCLRQ